MDFLATISNAFHQGGIWMYAILGAQIFSFAIMAERIYALYIVRSNRQKSLARGFEIDIKKGQIERVLARAQNLGRSNAISSVVQAGAQAAIDMGGREEIQAKMDEVLINENSKLEKRTGFLATIGNVGTLLGLLGTVAGMIDSFSSIATVNPVEKAAILSKGISMAMHSTAYGLIMAIPALLMYAVLQNRANTLAEDMNQAALMVFNWLSFNYESVPHRKGRSFTNKGSDATI
jgi:biopolymer transport protein ExbB